MKRYGLIGYPLDHSFSPAYFTEKFQREGREDCTYEAFPLAAIHELPDLLAAQPQLLGLNVTVPYKQAVIPFVQQVDAEAAAVGAVNTLVVHPNRSLSGFNTDVHGFSRSLEPLLKPHHNRALILGTGGAAKAVRYVLEQWSLPFASVSRGAAGDYTYAQLTPEVLEAHPVIINTTPLGMHPNTDERPSLPYAALNRDHLLYDLVYHPALTAFLAAGKERGATVKNGLEMLHLQAEKSWEIWQQAT
ncbi:MAG: shikimate dehydrogenase [Bacteroidota bacterium]